MKEQILENLSILSGYLYDNARLQREEGHDDLARITEAEALGVRVAMANVKRTFEKEAKSE